MLYTLKKSPLFTRCAILGFSLYKIVAVLGLGLILISSANTSAANVSAVEIVVVVNVNSPINSVTKEELKLIFMARSFTFNTGDPAIIVNLNDRNPLKKEFYFRTTGFSLKTVKNRWAAMVFSGQTPFPVELKNGQAVLGWIKENENTIGYMDAVDVTDEVKIVYRLLP